MARILSFVYLAVFVALFAACGSSSPKDVAMGFVEEVYKHGDSKDALKYIDLPKDESKRAQAENKMHMAVAFLQGIAEEAGGVKDIEFVSEDVKENTAVVKVKLIFGNGTSNTIDVNLVKVGGEWKIKN